MNVKVSSLYEVDHYRNGKLFDQWAVPNIVVTVGKNALLDFTFFSGAVTPAWYVGLVNNASFTAYAVADTMSSHGGWIEATAYSQATRPAYTSVAASAGSTSNGASRALFTITSSLTIRGAFMTSNSTKGGTTGTLYGEADFITPHAVIAGDILSVKITLSVS